MGTLDCKVYQYPKFYKYVQASSAQTYQPTFFIYKMGDIVKQTQANYDIPKVNTIVYYSFDRSKPNCEF